MVWDKGIGPKIIGWKEITFNWMWKSYIFFSTYSVTTCTGLIAHVFGMI